MKDKFEVLKLLFHAGVDMEVVDGKGKYPMHVAAANGSESWFTLRIFQR